MPPPATLRWGQVCRLALWDQEGNLIGVNAVTQRGETQRINDKNESRGSEIMNERRRGFLLLLPFINPCSGDLN